MTRAWSIRSRLTGVVLATVGVVLVALAALLYVVVRRAAWEQHDDALRERALALAAIVEHDDGGYEMVLPHEPPDHPASYIEVWTRSGEVIARSAVLHDTDLHRADGPLGATFADATLPDGRDGRVVTLRFLPRDEARRVPAEPLILVLEEGTEAIDRTVTSVGSYFIGFGAVALLAIFGVTTWSLRRGLRPLTELADWLEHVDDRRLATRLPSAGQPTELEVPIRKLNELLARLDASFGRERQFTADVGHELRTPLAGLRTLLEVTGLAHRTTQEYADAVARALDVVKQLGAVVENLLALARVDAAQPQPIASEDIELRAFVDECWRPYQAIAEARALRFSNAVAADARVRTDREKLRIVVANLMANAAEYTEAGGWITVGEGRTVVLEVADSGPPIASDQLERVFDRMWRGDAARTATGIHCGIGLSLARALCSQLSLSLRASSSAERVAFQITRS